MGEPFVNAVKQRYNLGHQRVLRALEDLTEEQMRWHPTPVTHSISWNIWHLGRWADYLHALSISSGVANRLLPESTFTHKDLRRSPCHRHRSSPSHHHPLETVRPRWPPPRSTRRNSLKARSGSRKLSRAKPHSTKSKDLCWKPTASASMRQTTAFRRPRRAASCLRRSIAPILEQPRARCDREQVD